jgi:hypothetical protein
MHYFIGSINITITSCIVEFFDFEYLGIKVKLRIFHFYDKTFFIAYDLILPLFQI